MPPEEPAAAPAAPLEAAVVETATILTPPSAAPEIQAEAVVETPAAEPAPAPEPPAPEAAAPEPTPEPAAGVAGEVKPHTDTPSLLETAGKTEEKPGEKKPEAEAPKPEGPAARTYEPFKLPEGIEPDEARLGAFRDVAGKHNLDQETAQQLLDMHTSTLKQFSDHLLAQQHETFAETRKAWVQKAKEDPVLGGAGFQTALMAAARVRDRLVPEEHRAEFEDFMRVTGAGDHPALFRLLHTAARLLDEPAAPPIPARPPPSRGPGPQRRQDLMYDHPTSRRAAGR